MCGVSESRTSSVFMRDSSVTRAGSCDKFARSLTTWARVFDRVTALPTWARGFRSRSGAMPILLLTPRSGGFGGGRPPAARSARTDGVEAAHTVVARSAGRRARRFARRALQRRGDGGSRSYFGSDRSNTRVTGGRSSRHSRNTRACSRSIGCEDCAKVVAACSGSSSWAAQTRSPYLLLLSKRSSKTRSNSSSSLTARVPLGSLIGFSCRIEAMRSATSR